MFSFQSKDLVVGFFRKALALVGKVIKLLNFFYCLSDLSCKALVDTVLVTLLLAPDIDFLPKVFVLSLKIVKNNVGFVKLVFEHLDFMLVLSHLGSGGPDSLERILLFA